MADDVSLLAARIAIGNSAGAGLLDRLTDRAGRLYSLPMVAVEVLRLTSHPKIDTRALTGCIENDPALTGKILRVVNSSLFGLSREVCDLNQALALLGTKSLKLLVLGFSLPDALFLGVAGDILRRYWYRTLTKAVACREISTALGAWPSEEAFIAGLLQDLGILVLIQELGEPYARFLDSAFARSDDIGSLEEEALGFDHATLSARLLEGWKLPPSIVESVTAGRPPDTLLQIPLSRRALPQILNLAELLAAVLTEKRLDLFPRLVSTALDDHQLSRGELDKLLQCLEAKVEQLANVLSLELPAGRDVQAIQLAAHAQLAEVAADAASQVALLEKFHPRGDLGLEDASRRLSSRVAELETLSNRPGLMADSRKRLPGDDATSPARARDAEHRSQIAKLSVDARAASTIDIDPGLLASLQSAVDSCRLAHAPLSILCLEVDRFSDYALFRGLARAEADVQQLISICRDFASQPPDVRQVRRDRFVAVLPNCERRSALETAFQVLAEARRISIGSESQAGSVELTASVGVATVSLPSKNFPARELAASAERCLHAAQMSGGNSVKSIELL